MGVKPDISDAVNPSEASSSDPDYLAWRDAKVRKALEAAKAEPEARIPQAEVWEKFGL